MKTLLFLGDSITDCCHSFDKDNLGEGYVRMVAENPRFFPPAATVKNMGFDGFTLAALKRLWNRISISIGSLPSLPSPDFITILIGINDIGVIKNTGVDPVFALEEFKLGYRTLIEQIQSTCSCPILLMEPFLFPRPAELSSWVPELHQMNAIIRRIADTCRTGFLPLWDALLTAAEKSGFDAITTDGIHLTEQGHRILADSWVACYTEIESQIKNPTKNKAKNQAE